EGIQKLTNLIGFVSTGNIFSDLTPLNSITTLEEININDGATSATTYYPKYDLTTLTNPNLNNITFVNSNFSKSFTEISNPNLTGEVNFINASVNKVSLNNSEVRGIK